MLLRPQCRRDRVDVERKIYLALLFTNAGEEDTYRFSNNLARPSPSPESLTRISNPRARKKKTASQIHKSEPDLSTGEEDNNLF